MQRFDLIGIQGGVASGSEPTFDGQAMSKGTHLRWGFAPELGFPPGGFQLCRRRAGHSEKRIPVPSELWVSGTKGPTGATNVATHVPTAGIAVTPL